MSNKSMPGILKFGMTEGNIEEEYFVPLFKLLIK
jgi:hypothetical protein